MAGDAEPLIRPATAHDVAAITAIYRPEVLEGTATFELEPPDAAEMLRRFDAIAGAGFPYLAAALDGALAGYAYAQPFRARPAYRFTVENSIYVARRAQGRGVGKSLLGALVSRAESLGFRQMIAVIGDSARQQSSIALHRSQGFEIVGRLPAVGFKHGRWLDSVQMQRPLGSGSDSPPSTAGLR